MDFVFAFFHFIFHLTLFRFLGNLSSFILFVIFSLHFLMGILHYHQEQNQLQTFFPSFAFVCFQRAINLNWIFLFFLLFYFCFIYFCVDVSCGEFSNRTFDFSIIRFVTSNAYLNNILLNLTSINIRNPSVGKDCSLLFFAAFSRNIMDGIIYVDVVCYICLICISLNIVPTHLFMKETLFFLILPFVFMQHHPKKSPNIDFHFTTISVLVLFLKKKTK